MTVVFYKTIITKVDQATEIPDDWEIVDQYIVGIHPDLPEQAEVHILIRLIGTTNRIME